VVTDSYARALLVRDRDPRPHFNSNLKNNLRRCEARLAAHGPVSSVRLAPGDDVAAWTEEFIRLEASGWKGREGSALGCREDDRRFVAEVFPEAFRRGRLLITGLDLDGRPLARHVMLAAGEGSFTFKIAYDEAYAKCSPGIVAEVDNVRQFQEHPGPRWIDSNTARENKSYGRVWKDRRTFQRVAVGARGAGRVAVAALPLMRLAKHWLAAKRTDSTSL
jgi:CelD/BcsL family acetyltransferase involved in cellulose biosynthesis